jgi:hypothetical protein
MIKDSPIVEDTRRIRSMISERFDHDIGRYIAYLQKEATSRQARKVAQGSDHSENRIVDTGNSDRRRKETRSN